MRIRNGIPARYLAGGVIATAAILALLLSPVVRGQGSVEPIRSLNVSKINLSPEVSAAFKELERQQNEINFAFSERLRKIADSICCP